MRFESLTYFLGVAECGSFTEASKRLYVSQQGLSKSIQSLERELDCRLFDRHGIRIELTDAGRALIPLAQRCLEDKATLKAEMSRYTVHPAKHLTKRKPFTLHAMPYVADTLFSLLHDDIARYGLNDVMIIEEDYPDILGGLDDEQASKVGALCLPDLELTLLEGNESIEFITLFKNDLLVVGTPELIGEKGAPLTTREIAQMPIAYYNDPTLNRMLSELFQDSPFQRVVTHTSSQARISGYVESGQAISFSDSLSVQLAPPIDGVTFAPIEGATRFTIGLAFAKQGKISTDQRDYIAQFEECCRKRISLSPDKEHLRGFAPL